MPTYPQSQPILQSDLIPANPVPGLTLEYSTPLGISGLLEAHSVTTDATGNIYTLGAFRGAVDFDPSSNSQVLVTGDEVEAFIRKQDANGQVIWVKQFAPGRVSHNLGMGSPIGYSLSDLETDNIGNVYAIGSFGVAKWDTSGNTLWLKNIAGLEPSNYQLKLNVDGLGNIYSLTSTGITKMKRDGDIDWQIAQDNVQTTDIGVDSTGNLYTIGTFSGTADFDPSDVTNILDSTNGNTFVRKFNPNRELVWVKQIDANIDAVSTDLGLAVNENGLYFTGSFRNAVDFDPSAGIKTLQATVLDIFVSKLDLNGNFLWAVNFNNNAYVYNNYNRTEIDVDARGDLYITGKFVGTVDFDPGDGIANLTAPVFDTNITVDNTFVNKLDTNGNFVWAKQFSSSNRWENGPTGISIDQQGNVLTIGNFYGALDLDPGSSSKIVSTSRETDGFLSKLNGSGEFIFGQQYTGELNLTNAALKADSRGNLYWGGSFSGSLDFTIGQTKQQINSSGSRDSVVGKLNRNGELEWLKSFGGIAADGISEIDIDQNGNLIVFGLFATTVDFDPGDGIFNLTSRFTSQPNSTPMADGFRLKLDANGNFIEAGLWDFVNPTLPQEYRDRWSNRYLVRPIFQSGAVDWIVQVEKRDRNNTLIWTKDLLGASAATVDQDGNIYTSHRNRSNLVAQFWGEQIIGLRKYRQSQAEIFWRNERSGYSGFWQMNNATELVGATMLTYGSNFGPNLAGQLVDRAPGWKLVGTADFNQDGVTDHIYQNGQLISIWSLSADANGQTASLLAAASPTLFGQSIDRVAPNWDIVGVADMNKDGYKDLIFQNTLSDYVGIWYMKANNQVLGQVVVTNAASSGFVSGDPARTYSSSWKIIGVADFDGDGEMELMFRSAIWNAVSIWKLKDGQFLGAVSLPNLASGFEASGIGDFNGDGIADVVWRDRSSGTTHIWTMNRQTVATQTTLVNGGGSNGWEIAAIGDMNFDGTDDLIWRNSLTDQSAVWLLKNAQSSIGSNFIRKFRPNGDPEIQLTGDLAWNIEAVNDFG